MGSKDNEILGLTRMTKKSIMDSCKKNKLYQTPALNDVLYLHYQGYQEIDCLDDYTTLKCLWLESNAISQIAGLENQKELRSLYLHNNLIKKIENLENCKDLDTLNISHNHIARVENCGIGILPVLTNLNLSHNYLKTLENLQGLVDCKEVSVLDLSNNRIDDILIVKLLSEMPKLKVLVLMGNPVVNSIPQYRKTLILECKQLTYLDTRPIFPKDRACAEAWKRGGYDEEMREHKLWAKKERQKMRDSVNATLRLRKNAGCKDEIPFMDSSDEDDEHKDYGIILPPIKNNEHLGYKMEDGKHREPIAQEEKHLKLIVSCNNISPRLGLEDNTSDAEHDKLKEKGAKFREILGDFQEPVKKDFHGELNENTNNFQLESINETAAPKTDRIMIENITPVKPKLKKVRIMVGDITPIERNKAPVIPIPTRATRQLFYEQNDSERINTIDFLDIFNDWNYNFFEIDASFEIKDITVNEEVADLMEDEKHTANVESCDVVKPSLNDSENVDENEVDQTFLDSHNLFLENICHKIKDLDISSGSQIDVLESPCTDHIPPNTSIKSTDDKNCVIFKMQTIKDLRRNPMTPENIDAIENLSEELHQIKCKQFDEESRKLDELLLTLNVEREKNNEIVENLRTQLFNIKTNCNAIYDRFDNIEKGKEIDFGNSFDLTSGFNSSESLN